MSKPERVNRRLGIVIGLFMIALPIGAALLSFNQPKRQVATCYFQIPVEGNQTCVDLEIADTPKQRFEGLSNLESLPQTTGMLFVFEENGNHCIWMKDVRFNLDILWLDDQGKIIDIKEDVSPETYPQSFCPSRPARYVIEVNSGVAATAKLEVSQTIKL